MSFDTFKKIVDEIARESPDTRLWLAIMGEALLLGDKLIEMILYAKKAGVINIHLNTNAVLMKPDLCEKLIMAGVSEIIIGIDSYREETYDKIRVGGDLTTVVENIKYLLDVIKERKLSQPRLYLQYILMDENEEEFEDFKQFWLNLGAKLKVRPKIGWGTAVDTHRSLNLPPAARTFPCPMLIRNCAIHWNGNFAHCSDADFEGEYSPGNIKNMSIKEVWNGELAKRREQHWKGDFSHDLCKNCRDWQTGRSLFFEPEAR